MKDNKKRNRLWRVPLAAAGIMTLVYVWVHGLNNVPINNTILSCFSGADGNIFDLPDQIILPFYISDLWNILLVAVVVFFLLYLFQESGKSETARKALGRLYDLGFLVVISVMTVHFFATDISGVNHWGPVYGGYSIYLFSFVLALISFSLRRKMGFVLSLMAMLFTALLIMLPLSLISGIPTGLFAAMISIMASFSACFLYSLYLWVFGERIFTSLDWLRSTELIREREGNKPLEQRLRYYLAEEGKYQQIKEGKVFYFSVIWGLKDSSTNSEKLFSLDEVIEFVGEFQRKKIMKNKLYLDGRVSEARFVYSFIEEIPFSHDEPQAVFSGFKDPVMNSELSDLEAEEFLCSLGAYVGERLRQERVLITYGDKVKVIKKA